LSGGPVRPKLSSDFLCNYPIGKLSEGPIQPQLEVVTPPKLSGVRVGPKLSRENFSGESQVYVLYIFVFLYIWTYLYIFFYFLYFCKFLEINPPCFVFAKFAAASRELAAAKAAVPQSSQDSLIFNSSPSFYRTPPSLVVALRSCGCVWGGTVGARHPLCIPLSSPLLVFLSSTPIKGDPSSLNFSLALFPPKRCLIFFSLSILRS